MNLDKNMEIGSLPSAPRVSAPCHNGASVTLRAPGVAPFKVQVIGISDDGRKVSVLLPNGDSLQCVLRGTNYVSPFGDQIVF